MERSIRLPSPSPQGAIGQFLVISRQDRSATPIHDAAGPGLLEACRAVPEVAPGVRCPTGEARITPAFDLPATWVVHAVGPRYRAHPAPASALASVHRACLVLAETHGAKSIAFPAISCGAYGYPAAAAAQIAASVVQERAWALREIDFVLFTSELLDAWRAAFSARSFPGDA